MLKVFNCELEKVEILSSGETNFCFKLADGSTKSYALNESPKRIHSRYIDIKAGKRNMIYCSFGALGNVDIGFNNGTVEFFDMPYMFLFEESSFKTQIEALVETACA